MLIKKDFEKELKIAVSKLSIHKRFDIIKIDFNVKYRSCIANNIVIDSVYNSVLKFSDEKSNQFYEKLAVDAIGAGLWISYCCRYDNIYDVEKLIETLPEHLTTISDCVKQDKMFNSMFTFLLAIMRNYEEIDRNEINNFAKKIAKIAKDNKINTKEYFERLYINGLIIFWSSEAQE